MRWASPCFTGVLTFYVMTVVRLSTRSHSSVVLQQFPARDGKRGLNIRGASGWSRERASHLAKTRAQNLAVQVRLDHPSRS